MTVRSAIFSAFLGVICTAACSKKTEPAGLGAADHDELPRTVDRRDPVASDRATLEQMKRAGADLSRSTHVIHYIFFPDRKSAEDARSALSSRFAGSFDEAFSGDSFLMAAEHHTVPSIENIGSARRELERLAADYSGTYDGWTAAVTE